MDGCRELWAAVLKQALDDAIMPVLEKELMERQLARERAKKYISMRLGSFDYACRACDLDPVKTQAMMASVIQKHEAAND